MKDKDREAYDRGQTQRDWDRDTSLPGITWSLFGPEQDHGSTANEQSAFDKGRDGEQLDGDKSSSGCFLSSACAEHAGLPGDCYELGTLRVFRDRYVSRLPNGPALLAEYDAVAPQVVKAIQLSPDRAEVFAHIYDTIRRAIRHIERADHDSAMAIYSRLFRTLRKRFPASLAEVLSYQNEDVVHRIARKQQLSGPQADSLFRDTLRFLYLAGTTNAKQLAPTNSIDAGWHSFLVFTRDYAGFCQTHFGKFIHHEPRRLHNAPSTVDRVAATFDVAREVFGPSLSENWTQRLRVGETEPCTSRCSPDTGGGGDECTPDSGD